MLVSFLFDTVSLVVCCDTLHRIKPAIVKHDPLAFLMPRVELGHYQADIIKAEFDIKPIILYIISLEKEELPTKPEEDVWL